MARIIDSTILMGFVKHALILLRSNKWFRVIFNLALLSFLVFVVYNYLSKDWRIINQLSIQLNCSNIFLSLAIFGINYFLFILCWHVLIRLYNVDASFRQNSYIYSLSQIGKLLPTPAWFISERVIKYHQNGIPKKAVLAATIVETALHFLVGGVILGLLQFNLNIPYSWLASLSIVPLFLIARFPKLLNPRWLGVSEGKFTTRGVGIIIILFSITWLLALPYFYLIVNSIGIATQIPIIDCWKIWIISSLVSYVAMLTLGGVGLFREFSLTILLGPYVSPPIAVLIAALSRIVITIGNFAFPFIYILFINLQRKLSKISTRQ